jgi:hypothetical protein
VIPLGGAGRGRIGECFTPIGNGGGHRSWPGKAGDGGGDPDRQLDRGEREESEWGLGWVG